MDTDPVLAEHAQAHGGIITRPAALEFGYDDPQISKLVHTGVWHVVRRGAYVSADRWHASSDRQRYLFKVRAVCLKLGDRAAVSHQSAVAVYHVPTDGLDLRQVHVTRTDMCRARVVGGVHHHIANGCDHRVRIVDGMRLLEPATVAIEVAGMVGLFQGVALIDAMLHAELTDVETLTARMAEMASSPGISSAPRALALANGNAESVGESHCRVTLHKLGFPEPELQVLFADEHGPFARVDMYWAVWGLVLEFDGRSKYGHDGATTADQVFQEKVREDRLRALGLEVVRVLWSDLLHPNELRQMMNAAVARAKLRRAAA